MASPGGTPPCRAVSGGTGLFTGRRKAASGWETRVPGGASVPQGKAVFGDLGHVASTGVQGLWFVIR